MKSIIFAAIALAGFSAAAPPSYHQYPRDYAHNLARDASYPEGTVIPYYKTIKEYVPRAAAPAPIGTVLDRILPTIPKREAKPMPKYKQYKTPPKYGSRKRQDLPAVPAVPDVPAVPTAVPVIGSVAKRQEVPDVSSVESELPASVPEVGSVA